MLRARQGNKKDTTESKSRDVFFQWAITGSKWFESEPFLKEQRDAQKGVNLDAGG
jgi:hypothetical protein